MVNQLSNNPTETAQVTATTPQGIEALHAQKVPARSCGSCTMCCKVYEVPPIDNKPRGVWCKHCKPGKGCGIWQERPQFCRDFHCHWIRDESYGPEWRPDVAKFVMNELPVGLVVSVDPGNPLAWRREPYHNALRRLAAGLNQQQRVVQVAVNDDITIITPDAEISVGPMGDGLRFHWEQIETPTGAVIRMKRVERLSQTA